MQHVSIKKNQITLIVQLKASKVFFVFVFVFNSVLHQGQIANQNNTNTCSRIFARLFVRTVVVEH